MKPNPKGKHCAQCGRDIRPESYLTNGRNYFCNLNAHGIPMGCYERWKTDSDPYPDNIMDEFDSRDFFPLYEFYEEDK